MLEEKDLDIVLIATPDHWHALPMIAAVEAGADVYVQKPISVDVVEGQAMLAAARKHKRVVQVGTQRRSTPHLIEARDQIVKRGQARQGRPGRDLLLLPHARDGATRPTPRRPTTSTTRCGPAPRPCGRTTRSSIPRGWRAFMEYGNGIVGDMCIHMLDMVRWMLGPRLAEAGQLRPAASSWTRRARRTSPTPRPPPSTSATSTSSGSTAPGATPPDPKYPWGATLYGDKGTLKASVMSYDFMPQGGGEAVHKDVTYELEQYPEDKTEKDLEQHVAPAIRGHMKDFLAAIETRGKPGRRHRARLHLHARLHPGQPLHEARPHAGLGPRPGPGRGRRRGQPPPAPALPRALGPPGSGHGVAATSRRSRR